MPNNQFLKHADREITPAFTLNSIGQNALKKAEQGDVGWRLELITALLMCPLSIEAVLNHVGVYLFQEKAKESNIWDAIERQNPRKKLEAIAERCNLSLNFEIRPFQDFILMFKFRDSIVHAKTIKLTVENIQLPETGKVDDLSELQVFWEKMCKIPTVKKWQESVEKISDILCESAGCTDPIHFGDFSIWSL